MSTLYKQPGPVNWIPLLLSLAFLLNAAFFSLRILKQTFQNIKKETLSVQ